MHAHEQSYSSEKLTWNEYKAMLWKLWFANLIDVNVIIEAKRRINQ